ncbi:recQ-mediated genome instability protein 1 [Pieris rapae]|uniref:recQ-mediated genome instability protein 1 n=1 Tax=Pieris rapae TaxID=64459 RepID=UPI001E27F63D|nr:recQ-mediated genome instability protein 1 [Pieris rapae]
MSLNCTINIVRAFLASNHMLVDNEWLSGCVEFLIEDNSHTETEIKNLAKEQWLLNDLKDICPGSLPGNLKNQHKTTLSGRFVLQINAVVDIGTPAYQQYLKLQKVNTENIEATTKFDDKVSNHRMIKLYMTDGVQDVTGIEYKPMRNLSCDITPGCKVLVKGPIECRRGMMLLTESSVELLGGEVQEIVVSNSLAGLLSSKLGLPITQDPSLNTITSRRNTDIPSPNRQVPPLNEPTFDQTTRPIARVKSIQVHNDDDDFDLDQLAAIEAEFSESPSNTNTQHSNEMFKPPYTGDSTETISGALNSDKPYKRLSDNNDSQPEKKLKLNTADDYPEEDDLFEDEDYLKELELKLDEREMRKLPIEVSPEPFVYIRQINGLSVYDKVGKAFKIKGQIMKLLSKLSVGKEGWSLKCTLVDGTGAIDVEFTSDVLSNLVGITPQEMADIKKQIAKKPELKEKAMSALEKAKQSLQALYCIIEITYFDVPKITQLIPFDSRHVHLLKERQQSIV